ncbi:uncharacterized protein BJ212DRAFT_1500091 [Suillus subaureus]|uniref:Uncharacterized protein n=1 Tax=Suillus subaureus TaxID=48587 RepID=A0A9P7ECU5_9AGAM|nr:uncharacterized protein BJ212DRAFT_1500091 [Suillus subaureus]KAG1817616.1 hypothetical protein BJ212DRAFT_1500091 [Suillus subaureus]
MQLTIPATCIIPLTPAGLGNWDMPTGLGEDWDMVPVFAPFAPFSEDAVMMRGQRNDEMNATLQEGFIELEHVINDLTHNMSIPSSQIISLWNKSHAHTVNNVNHWNAYANYFKNNLKQELSRLGDEAPEAPSTPSASVHCKCYNAFKKSFPNDWQDILKIYGETALFLSGPQTVSAQGQEFQQFMKKLSGLMDTGVAHFGFKAALVACGKVINQDSSLGMAHTTSGAADFWLSQCKADKDTIIGHLKVQVYNLASLAVVKEAFEDEVVEVQGNACVASKPPAECVDITKNGLKWIKDEISHQIDIHGGKLSSIKIFPWKTLPSELTRNSLVIKGYPDNVLLPSGVHSNANKGIANLTLKEISTIIVVLQAGTMYVAKVSKAKQSKLVTSEVPILVGTPPAGDSEHAAGHCLFVNGQSDCWGLPCQKPSMATTRIKVVQHPTGQKKVEKMEKKANKKVEKKVEKKAEKKVEKKVGKEVISLMSSDAQPGSEDLDEDLDENLGDAPNDDSNYEDNDSSKKQKVKSEGPSRASKKRVSPTVAPVEKTVQAKKTKGKAPIWPKAKGPAEKRALPEAAESSRDEQVPDVAGQGMYNSQNCLWDGPVDSSNDSGANKAAAETHSNNADATNILTTCPLSPSSPSPTHHGSADLVLDNICGESLMPVAKVCMATQEVQWCMWFAPGFACYPLLEYYHDPHMPHAPQALHAPQAPHGPQHQYRSGGYHNAPYHDNQDGYKGYIESYWHSPSHAYFGSGGRYEHGYGWEYPNEYPKDQEDGGQAP